VQREHWELFNVWQNTAVAILMVHSTKIHHPVHIHPKDGQPQCLLKPWTTPNIPLGTYPKAEVLQCTPIKKIQDQVWI
jgi:hypothetical protein